MIGENRIIRALLDAITGIARLALPPLRRFRTRGSRATFGLRSNRGTSQPLNPPLCGLSDLLLPFHAFGDHNQSEFKVIILDHPYHVKHGVHKKFIGKQGTNKFHIFSDLSPIPSPTRRGKFTLSPAEAFSPFEGFPLPLRGRGTGG